MYIIDLNTIKRILILKQREIGDVLLISPAIRAIREKLPSAYIAVLVNSGTEDMISLNPSVNEVIVFNREWKHIPPISNLLKQFRFIIGLYKKRFDLVFDMTGGDRGAFFSLITGSKYRVAYNFKKGFYGKRLFYTHLVQKRDTSIHMVLENLNLIKEFGFESKEDHLEIYLSDSDMAFSEEILNKYAGLPLSLKVHIHPVSKWLFKCWRDDAFAWTIDYLIKEYNAYVFITSSPSKKEIEKVKNIISLCKNTPIDLSGATTLKQMAALTKQCNLFIGVDSAPMHIAAAIKTPIIALFGPSGFHHWGPWITEHIVLFKDMPCRPCGQDGCNGSKHSLCLDMITTEDMREAIDKMLTQKMQLKSITT